MELATARAVRSRPASIPSPRRWASSTRASATTRSSTTTATSPAASSSARCRSTWRVGSADATLAVYNALRGYLPELAALAANAPFHAGRDTGLRLDPAADRRAAAAPGRPAGDRVLGGLRGDAGWGARRASPRAAAVVVGAAPARRLRHARGARLRRPDDAGRGRGGGRLRACADRLAARALRAGEALPVRRVVADRREPLDRRPARAGRPAADLETGERRPVRELLRERLETLAPSRSGSAAPTSSRACTRCSSATAPSVSARSRPSAACRG